MEAIPLFMIAASVLAVTAPVAWMLSKEVAGVMSRTSFREDRAIFPWVVGGLLFGTLALVVRHDWAAWLVVAISALVGTVAGGTVGWLTRDASDRDRR